MFGALILSLFAFSTPSFAGILLDRIAAVVSDTPILESDIESLRKELRASPALSQIYGIDPATTSRDQMLDILIEDKIVEISVKDLSLGVTEAEVDAQIQKIASSNRINVDQLKISLLREGVNFDAYKKNIRKQLEKRNLFERELRTRGGGLSEEDLKNIYFENAPIEVKVQVATLKGSRAAEASKLTKNSINKAPFESWDWTDLGSLDATLQKALKDAQPKSMVGPIVLKGNTFMFYVEDRRIGSDEGFEKAREEIAARTQSKDVEKRFKTWIDKKKKELQIVVNPL